MKSNGVEVETAHSCGGILWMTRHRLPMRKSRRTGANKILRAVRDQGDRWGLLAWRSGSLFPKAKKLKFDQNHRTDAIDDIVQKMFQCA